MFVVKEALNDALIVTGVGVDVGGNEHPRIQGKRDHLIYAQ